MAKLTKHPNLIQVIKSVLAALFGVQSNKIRTRDFEHGNPLTFIVVGIILVSFFVLILYLGVRLVMNNFV